MNNTNILGKVWKGLSTNIFGRLPALAAALCLTVIASNASALPFPNPNPPGLNDDVDGTGYFDTGAIGSLAIELFDLADGASTFGFFDANDPGTLIPIFDAADVTGDAAIIDFNAGYVFDNEEAAIQTLFAPASTIGFYLGVFNTVLYSDPTLNLGGADLMGAFTSTTDDFLSILFYDAPASGPSNLLSWHVISDLQPSTVPTPASLLLVLFGLGALVSRRAKQ